MANGNQPGDGRTNPFTGPGAGSMSGNNFLINPGGSRSGGTPPRDFQDAHRAQPSAGQRTNTSDAAPGPETAAEVVNRPGAGVGSVGNAARPFRLGGE